MSKSLATPFLRRMRQLIKRGWTQHDAATTRTGQPVCLYSAEAQCFCLLGARERVISEADQSLINASQVAVAIRDAIDRALPRRWREKPLDAWNDARGRTKAQVVALLDRAIELDKRAHTRWLA